MPVHSLKAIQRIPASLPDVWTFFSNPANLASITPGTLGFQVISKHHGDQMYAGQIIEYKVRPIAGIPLYWMTEITHIDQHKYFVDEQRFGPYSLWHHQHHFNSIDGGVEMTDIVHYKIPMGFLGGIANRWLVKQQLQTIFNFRRTAASRVFGEWPGADGETVFY